MGTMAKAVYWQQEALNSNGILNWNIGFLPYVNGAPYDVWENHSIYPAISPANDNGEGIFLYESASLGLDPANPIVSLRLKHMSNGMEDYDYLQLAKEAFGTDEDSPYMQAMNMVFRFYTSAGHQYIFSCESSPWDGNHPYEWIAHYDDPFVNARVLLGNALSEAMAGQHEYGEWQTVVLPDETHNGLEIRTCSHCGAQESREIPPISSNQENVLSAGTNWWSTNLDITLDDLKSAIVAALGSNGTAIIKSQSTSIVYSNGMWIPESLPFDIREMYKIQVSEACEITLTGVRVNSSEEVITINPGNNWIGVPSGSSMTLTEAFTGLNPMNGDVVKSQTGSSVYNDGNWVGTVGTLEPGQGYLYYSKATDVKTFTFGTSAKYL